MDFLNVKKQNTDWSY